MNTPYWLSIPTTSEPTPARSSSPAIRTPPWRVQETAAELAGTFYELDLDYGTSETDFTARIVSDINAKLQPDERLQWGTLTTSEPIQLQNRLTLPLTIQLIADPRDLPPLFDALPLETKTATVTIWEDVTEVQLGLISDHDRHSCLIFPDLANRAHLDILHTNFLTAGTQQFSVTETELPDTHRTRFNHLDYSSGHDSHTLRGFYDLNALSLYANSDGLFAINQPYTTAPDLGDLQIRGFPGTDPDGITAIFGGIHDPDDLPNPSEINLRPSALNIDGIDIFAWSVPVNIAGIEPLNEWIGDNLPGGTLLYWTIICWVARHHLRRRRLLAVPAPGSRPHRLANRRSSSPSRWDSSPPG